MKSILFVFAVLFGLVFSAPLFKMPEKVEDEYIVVLHENVTVAQKGIHLSKFFSKSDNSTFITNIYKEVLTGYSAKMTQAVLQQVLADPLVNYVEENGIVRAIACTTQANAPSWGIKRISLPAPVTGNTNFRYPSTAGAGVTAYIIDTGIYIANNDFGGRASFGFQASGTGSTDDKNGHGTHVASTVGGTTYGIAKASTLVAVKVLGDNGSGTNAGVISGVDWVTANGKGKKATANMSLGGSYSAATNTAVDNCANAGIVIVVAAGNDNRDAANYSPASAAKAITVGSTAETNSGGATTDTRSSFSNYGTSVDIFAPGTSITAAWIGSANAINTISGTSMASPHVCGVATVLLGTTQTGTSAKSYILSTAKTGLINLSCGTTAACNNSPNKFLYLDPTC